MTIKGTMAISTVTVEVPVTPIPRRRSPAQWGTEPRRNVVSLAVGGTSCQVWDLATYTDCGATYTYKPTPIDVQVYGDVKMTDIPYFPAVFRFMSEQYATHRTNPLGEFLHGAIIAMETHLAEKDGSCVYFAEADGRIKIGQSRRVASRIADLQTGNASPLKLLGVIPGGPLTERRLHKLFSTARLSGEWFEATPALVTYIQTATA